jgi:hypothetical protein
MAGRRGRGTVHYQDQKARVVYTIDGGVGTFIDAKPPLRLPGLDCDAELTLDDRKVYAIRVSAPPLAASETIANANFRVRGEPPLGT